MTLAVYPLVYLPVAASFRAADPGQEEVARSLGVGRVRTFIRVTLGQARGAILGGCLLVAMVMLAEYGAFEILGYQTFTTEIFTEFSLSFSVPAACALSLVLVVLGLVVLGGEGMARGRGRVSRSGPLVATQPAAAPAREGHGARAGLGFVLLVVLALGVPVGSSIYWIFEGGAHAISPASPCPLPPWPRPATASPRPRLTPCSRCPWRCWRSAAPGRIRHVLERSTYLVLAMPGVVVAFALSYFTEHYVDGFGYQSAPLLVLGYAIMFFPLALVGVKASLARAPASLEDMARSLGQRRLAVLLRVTLPARRAGPRRGVLPGVPVRRHRADRDAAADPDRGADAVHAVLGLREQPVLRPGRPVRPGDDRHRRAAELRARQVLRPLQRNAEGITIT